MKTEWARPKGASLAELLIATALFGLISIFIAMLIRSGYAYLRQAEARAELQRSSLFVLSDLSREVSESSSDSIRCAESGDPPGIVFAVPRGADGKVDYQDNHLLWKKWVCVYWDSDKGLILRVEEPLSTPTTFKPDPFAVGLEKTTGGFAGMANLSRRVLARNVSDFSAAGQREVEISIQVTVNEGEKRSRLTTRSGIRPNH